MFKKIIKIGLLFSLTSSFLYAIDMNQFQAGQQICLNNFQKKLNLPCSYFLALLENNIDDPTQAESFLNNINNVFKIIDSEIQEYKEDMSSPFSGKEEITYDKKQILTLNKMKKIIKQIYSNPIEKQEFVYFYSQVLNGYIPSTCQ